MLELMEDNSLKTFCWNLTSQKAQAKILKLEKIYVLEAFFQILNDHDLCVTANLHYKHSYPYRILLECISEKKQKIIEYYIEYGTVIGSKI